MPAVLLVDGVNISASAKYDVTVDVGRDNVDSQPDAAVLSAVVLGWRPAGTLYSKVVLRDQFGQLFAGRTTDLATTLVTRVETDDNGREVAVGTWETTMSAVSSLGDLGRIYVGDEPWPEETDSQRIVRILTLAGVDTNAIDPDVAGPLILPRDVDHKPALELCQQVANDSFGVLWEQPSAEVAAVRYTPQVMRSWSDFVVPWKALPDGLQWQDLPRRMTWETFGSGAYDPEQKNLEVSGRYVLTDVSLEMHIADLARRVRVAYGPKLFAEDGTTELPRTEAVVGDEPPELARDTQLANALDAQEQAETLWRSRRNPTWQMKAVTFRPLEELPDGVAEAVRKSLAIGSRITIQDADYDSPLGERWQGYLEGWQHQLSDGRHTVTMYLSGRALTEPSERWSELHPTATWSQIEPEMTWDSPGWSFVA